MIRALQRSMTFDQFLDWYPEGGKRYELIDGEASKLPPAATLSGWLSAALEHAHSLRPAQGRTMSKQVPNL
ncbi:MAG: Uma2 family endonuclease [Aphanocapsa sp. GSE-SYN-MK-11-07L]|nr:Uma2 family endonuclease [Aphanocapsa sp. GSE-SYN-MK-11-07L]